MVLRLKPAQAVGIQGNAEPCMQGGVVEFIAELQYGAGHGGAGKTPVIPGGGLSRWMGWLGQCREHGRQIFVPCLFQKLLRPKTNEISKQIFCLAAAQMLQRRRRRQGAGIEVTQQSAQHFVVLILEAVLGNIAQQFECFAVSGRVCVKPCLECKAPPGRLAAAVPRQRKKFGAQARQSIAMPQHIHYQPGKPLVTVLPTWQAQHALKEWCHVVCGQGAQRRKVPLLPVHAVSVLDAVVDVFEQPRLLGNGIIPAVAIHRHTKRVCRQ